MRIRWLELFAELRGFNEMVAVCAVPGAAGLAWLLASSPPSPSPPKRRRGEWKNGAGYPGWRLCLADPGYFLKPDGVLGWLALCVRGCCGGGVALAAESAKPPSGELCWPADCKEHLHSEPRLRHGAALAASAAHPTVVREAAYFCLCGADGRAPKAFDNPAGWNALHAFELDGASVARARSERAAEEGVR